MTVYWLTQNLAEVPPSDAWLSPDERAVLATLRFPKRRADWRLGRWTAKRALLSMPIAHSLAKWNLAALQATAEWEAFARLEIRAARDGAPEAFCDNAPLPMAISLSHRNDLGFCAIGLAGANVGCDVEFIEPRSAQFVADYFTAEEQALVARANAEDRDWLSTLIWSAKESALKVLREGLRRDTRSVVVELATSSASVTWAPLIVRSSAPAQTLFGWWQKSQQYVQTVLADSKADSLCALTLPSPRIAQHFLSNRFS